MEVANEPVDEAISARLRYLEPRRPPIGNSMTTSQPDHQRRAGRRPDDDAAMETFTVRVPRWLFVRLFGRNPLIRTSRPGGGTGFGVGRCDVADRRTYRRRRGHRGP